MHHRAVQCDLAISDPLALLGIERVDAVYSDPPWGPGNLMFWRTHNGETERPAWPTFLARFADVARRACPDGSVWVEMGTRWEQDLADAMATAGLPHVTSIPCIYRAGSKMLPNTLMLFGRVPPPETALAPKDRHGPKLVTWALDVHPGSTVLDPCCGLGTTAKACIALGRTFYGTELNPKRLARTQSILDRGTKARRA